MYNEIVQAIKTTISENEEQILMWKEPIVEVISAENENLVTLKEMVSDEHLLPCDILPDAKSIVSYFVPFRENIVESNIDGELASKEWVSAYIKTNELLKKISESIEALLQKKRYKAGKAPAAHSYDKAKLISSWSHRHIAYIAGIGTFGMNNMLITKNGCCGRFGSIVTNYEFGSYKQTGRAGEKCIEKSGGACGRCRKKCVVNAYEGGTFDRYKCYGQCRKNDEYHKTAGNATVCGKCLVDLPCSLREPV
ncbi:MAG: hypothetical protein FWG99_12335 [Treponema sp.]|nr:hypothetical protein [Treponema sp.]